jgi:hypothetical protein
MSLTLQKQDKLFNAIEEFPAIKKEGINWAYKMD